MKLHLTDDALRKELRLPDDKAQLVAWDTKQAGFGVVVGRTKTTFVANRRVAPGPTGLKREAIGHWSGACEGCDDAGHMDARTARNRALGILGKIERKEATPGTVRRARSTGPTLAEACGHYVARLRAEGKQPASIDSVNREIGERDRSYLKAWLDRPLASITGKECRARHESITTDNGPHVANRVMRELRAIWNHVAKEASAGTIDGLPEGHVFPANPTIAVRWNKEGGESEMVDRRREPVSWSKLPAWYAAVIALGDKRLDDRGRPVWGGSPIRRDYNLLVMLTGLRRNDAATVRWEHVNTTDEPVETRVYNKAKRRMETVELKPRSLLRPSPKGGAKRAFAVPLSAAIIDVLERRRRENALAFPEGDTFPEGDRGWVFPSLAIKGDHERKQPCRLCPALGMPAHAAGSVTHLAEPKEDGDALVSPHRLRDTYTTACAELEPALSPFVVDVLTNHRPPKGSVTAGYIGELDLHDAQERVSAFLDARFRPGAPRARSSKATQRKGRGTLRAVP